MAYVRARDSTHECPMPECIIRVSYNKLACLPHWRALPAELRELVEAAYVNRKAEPWEHLRAVARAQAWYKAAQVSVPFANLTVGEIPAAIETNRGES